MITYIKSKLNEFYFYRYLAYKKHKKSVLSNPKIEANRAYYPFFKKNIDLDNPVNLIEKIYWLQFKSDTSLWTKYADKYLVRNYIKECGYEDNLPELYGKWEDANDIDFDKLPDSFVLKTNNGCGTVLVIKDKSKLNIKSTIKQLNEWLSIPYGYRGAQLHYTKINPCIIAEELLVQSEEESLISPKSLMDYKVYCINGEPEAIWVSYNRDRIEGVTMTMYDLNWVKQSQNLVSSDYYTYSENDIPKPPCLEEMLEMSRTISKPFSHVRVDFYIIDNKPVLGEMTFTTGWGFFTYDFYDYLGKKIDLDNIKEVRK